MWLIAFNNPAQLLFDNTSLLVFEVFIYIITGLIVSHIIESNKRRLRVFVAVAVSNVAVLLLHTVAPLATNIWHAQAMIMIFGSTLPLYLILAQTCIIFLSLEASTLLRVHPVFVPSIVGLLTVLLHLPMGIIGSKFLWWTWHDTDPSLVERHLGVPWISLYHQFTFSTSYSILSEMMNSLSFSPLTSNFGMVIVSLFSFSFGVVLFLPVYFFLHQFLSVSSEMTTLLLLFWNLVFVWIGERRGAWMENVLSSPRISLVWQEHSLFLGLLIYFFVLFLILITGRPENVVSNGFHQILGDCSQFNSVISLSGILHSKKSYLCSRSYDENFTFCDYPLHQLPYNDPWYMICGTPYSNFAEYFLTFVSSTFFGIAIFYEIFFTPRNLSYYHVARNVEENNKVE